MLHGSLVNSQFEFPLILEIVQPGSCTTGYPSAQNMVAGWPGFVPQNPAQDNPVAADPKIHPGWY